MMQKWFLPTISEILANAESDQPITLNYNDSNKNYPKSNIKAEKEWYAAIASVEQLLTQLSGNIDRENCAPDHHQSAKNQGLILSAPTPILSEPHLNSIFTTGIFHSRLSHNQQSLHLLPLPDNSPEKLGDLSILPLLENDPLSQERFCLILTHKFSLILSLGKNLAGETVFLFSFVPEVIEQVLLALRYRLLLPILSQPLADGLIPSQELLPILESAKDWQTVNNLTILDKFINNFFPLEPDYKIVMEFSRLMLKNLPLAEVKLTQNQSVNKKFDRFKENSNRHQATKEVELLQAIAHEIRTPLTTIRTLTRLLLKQKNLDKKSQDRLQMIDQECTTQIDRFNLIFRAVEMEVSHQKPETTINAQLKSLQLTAIPLSQVFQTNLPKWEKQAIQRQHTLEVILPNKLPKVVSDPTMLEQILTGLLENFSRSLPTGSHIQVGVMLAGSQLKLQLQSYCKIGDQQSPFVGVTKSNLQSLGPLLMLQPETGCVSLNLAVTKNLFQAIGGKLVVRQKRQQGEVMTVFLPLQELTGVCSSPCL